MRHFCWTDRAQVSAQYPSVDWGVRQWYEALRDDDELFYRILDGIALGGIRPKPALP